MNILLFGESCTGKSSVATILAKELNMKVYSGKDYLRLAKTPQDALTIFKGILENEEDIIFVAAEKEHVSLVTNDMIKILFTAPLEVKKERFAHRFHGNLPKPVEMMLERKHGMFDDYECDLSFDGSTMIETVVSTIRSKLLK